MEFKNGLKAPMSNEEGFATLIMIAVIIVVVGSYILYAINYFQILTTEVKRFKRQVGGIAIMQQIGQKAADARARHQATWTGVTFNCSAAGSFSEENRQLCLRDGPNSNRVCVNNPFGDPAGGTNRICFQEDANITGGDARTIEISLTDEQLKNYPKHSKGWIHDLNMAIGSRAIAWIYRLANHAQAYDDRDRPVLSSAPTLTRQTVACANGADPTLACMQCQQGFSVPPIGTTKPVCYRLKVCIRPGGCDDSEPDQWFWQLIAVLPGYGS